MRQDLEVFLLKRELSCLDMKEDLPDLAQEYADNFKEIREYIQELENALEDFTQSLGSCQYDQESAALYRAMRSYCDKLGNSND